MLQFKQLQNCTVCRTMEIYWMCDSALKIDQKWYYSNHIHHISAILHDLFKFTSRKKMLF